MAEFPSLPIFTDSLLADTAHLSHEEFGAYMRLLIMIWRSPECRIPVADAWLMRKLQADDKQFNELFRPLLSEYLQSDGGWYTQKRLSKEFDRARRISDKNRGNANSLWNKRKSTQSGNAPIPIPIPTVENNSNELFSDAPKQPKGNGHAKRTRKPTTFIAEDFGGDFKAVALAASLGVDFEYQQRKFIDHYLAKGESRADWQASFRTWLNISAEHRARDQQRQTSGRSDAPSVVRAALRVAARGPQTV